MQIHLLVDGRSVAPERENDDGLRFRIELPAGEIRLRSGSARPMALGSSADDRRLGVVLHQIRWSREHDVIDVPLDAPDFVDGFYEVERWQPDDHPARWTTGDAGMPPEHVPSWQGPADLHIALSQWEGSAVDPTASAEYAVLSQFESLGEDCDFGLVQRRHQVEPPMTLFRWAGVRHAALTQGLENRFEGLGEVATTTLRWTGEEYRLQNPYFSMHADCTTEQDAEGIEKLLIRSRASLRLLRRRLLHDLAHATRIFVFKCADPEFGRAEMDRLHAALRRFGAVSLLCVLRARAGLRGGHAERLGDGLYAGYLDAFALEDGPHDQWILVCAKTLALHRHG